MSSMTYEGPIPPAPMMAEFDRIIPNGADRIMKMAEKQQDHEISERKYINRIHGKVLTRSQVLPFILLMSMVIAGTFLIYIDKVVVGAGLISPAALIAFIAALRQIGKR